MKVRRHRSSSCNIISACCLEVLQAHCPKNKRLKAENRLGLSINSLKRKKMKKNIPILAVGLLMTAPAFGAAPDDNNGTKQTLIVNNEKVERIVSEIRIDGNNAVLAFTDGTTMTADMRLVTITMSYSDATGVSSLHMTDKDGNVSIYDLQGRKVTNKPKANSLYIINGKKVVNKK